MYGEEKYLSLQKIKFIVVGSGKLLKIIQNKGSKWDDSYQFFMKLHLIDPPQPPLKRGDQGQGCFILIFGVRAACRQAYR
ncbi:hypothetical protein WN50_39130 [Limnoraphis robusta CS-951]|uniref:Uncharacterized protein n=1 Tax=Limnoraphis robusta CS-951 TaxID=1637645 RepID=A0A0J9EXR5_9CYAN|nr:hypothetical protein WN50_39130 [Limnoraphis robusta CS-951]